MKLQQPHSAKPQPRRIQVFLNRRIVLNGTTYRFQSLARVAGDDGKPARHPLPAGRANALRGHVQTQFGLAERSAVIRSWPFVVVNRSARTPRIGPTRPCSICNGRARSGVWPNFTATLRALSQWLSMGGYGAWELARLHPHRWVHLLLPPGALLSYERPLAGSLILPAEYARAVAHAVGLFTGRSRRDSGAKTKQAHVTRIQIRAETSPLIYQGSARCWTRASMSRAAAWLLAHHLPRLLRILANAL